MVVGVVVTLLVVEVVTSSGRPAGFVSFQTSYPINERFPKNEMRLRITMNTLMSPSKHDHFEFRFGDVVVGGGGGAFRVGTLR